MLAGVDVLLGLKPQDSRLPYGKRAQFSSPTHGRMSQRRLPDGNDLLRVKTRSRYVSELGSFTRRKTHVQKHASSVSKPLYTK